MDTAMHYEIKEWSKNHPRLEDGLKMGLNDLAQTPSRGGYQTLANTHERLCHAINGWCPGRDSNPHSR